MNREERKRLIIAGAALITALALLVFFHKVTTAEAINITVTAILVMVTVVYAKRTADIAGATKDQAEATKQQAEASVKMAEEMREERLTMHKPHIVMRIGTTTRGNYFATEVGVSLKNEGRGSALNVRLVVIHPVFHFKTTDYPYPIAVGEKIDRYVQLQNDEKLLGYEQPAVLAVDYEDVLGNSWHSTLELRWDTGSRDLMPGRTQVAMPGYLNSSQELR